MISLLSWLKSNILKFSLILSPNNRNLIWVYCVASTSNKIVRKDRIREDVRRHLVCSNTVPRFSSRPKLSYDQTMQTEMTSDQTFQTKVTSDQTFQTKIIFDQTFQTKMSSDQTEPRPLSRLECAYDQTQIQTRVQTINKLWSDHLQTMVQTQIQTIAPTLIRLWSDSSALKIVWSEKDFNYEKISSFCYNIFIS